MTTDPRATLAALEEDFGSAVGVRLYTVLAWLPGRRVLHRVHSNHPQHYPVGGEKSVEVAAGWLAQCIRAGLPYLGATEREVQEIFGDHVLISSLGCGAVINLPVSDGDRVLGAINLLDAEGTYDTEAVARAERLAPAAVPALTTLVAQLEGQSR